MEFRALDPALGINLSATNKCQRRPQLRKCVAATKQTRLTRLIYYARRVWLLREAALFLRAK
ncbi:hypothetical protein NQZ68_014744 [Dissostichus eleginoides]|nr:hypothetical protein NQZ68_014744 [Dissostichus eleginoides]